ncbi:MAG: hypothetical protein IJV69_04315, partial [Kiritimatiellae bacterium]|nr:hypothetical protein [Kiritimatiellia bacterium]
SNFAERQVSLSLKLRLNVAEIDPPFRCHFDPKSPLFHPKPVNNFSHSHLCDLPESPACAIISIGE